ncbi:glycosyltransferase [Treponema sp. HNW]|uniref:glycosyltransferase n=1 Tax=Treponema sp. HNW TaxID=3116654 RepID=UPI003D10C6B3
MQAGITVIIPTYNKADYISQTIESVLSQTYQKFEIVIIDDCSQDNTELVVQKYLSDKIRYFKHVRNWGPGATFNDGIEKANTEYITLIAGDDLLLPEHLEIVIDKFNRNNKVNTIYTSLQVINENNEYLDQIITSPFTDRFKLLNDLFYMGNRVPSPGISFKKELFKKIKPFNEVLTMTHDYDLNIRCMVNGEIDMITKPTVLYRRFCDAGENLSSDTHWFYKNYNIERKIILDNFLNLQPPLMIHIFPQLKKYQAEQLKFMFLLEISKNKDELLSSWAFERLITYLETNQDFFKNNTFNFQYKDYINLYKECAKNSMVKLTHKKILYNSIRDFIKKIFSL